MAEEIDLTVIKKTQEILGSIIRKPALAEKSLKKPPFRFLHDIIINVIKTSGFCKGLYTSEELQSDNVKDKESKIAFLQKAIDVLALVTNQPINLKPSKVVAGHEPQKTNIFLQILGTAVKNKLDSKEAVEKVLNAKIQGSPTKALKEHRASVDKHAKGANEKAHTRSLTKTLDPVRKSSVSYQSKEMKSKDGEKAKDRHKDSKKDREKSRERMKHKTDDSKKTKDKISKQKEGILDNEGKVEHMVDGGINDSNNTENNLNSESQLNEELSISTMVNGESQEKEESPKKETDSSSDKPVQEKNHRPPSRSSARPPSARNKRTKSTESSGSAAGVSRETLKATSSAMTGNVPSVSEPDFESMPLPRAPSACTSSARPSSSRPAPPRIRIRHVVENEEPSLRPATAKPVENVILDQGHQSEEEDETFILLETEPVENLELQKPKHLPAETSEEDKGTLVKKLLETKKDLEGGSQHTPTKIVEIDKSQMSEASRNRERDSASKELGQLRNFVQSLSKTAVPLGRMLDFLQEDLDAMKMELKIWREEHEQNFIALHKEQSATESLLEPLRAQLDDLDQVVQNQLDANSALKSSIARNDERIQRMLASVNHKS